MALTITVTERVSLPKSFTMVYGQITFDSSYPTNGEAVVYGDFKFGLELAHLQTEGASTNGYVSQWDKATGKIQMYEAGADAAALDEVANTTDLSAELVNFIAFGL
jgi:hypothetical protein